MRLSVLSSLLLVALTTLHAQEKPAPALTAAQQQAIDAAVAAEDSPPVPTKAKAQPRGAVTGQVTLSDTHAPGRGARILLINVDPGKNGDVGIAGQQQMGIAGLDGSFLIPHVAPGDYAVVALSVGYLSPLQNLWVDPVDPSRGSDEEMRKKLIESNATMMSIHGPETANVEVELNRGAVLSGRVLYSDGSPASQVRVELQRVDDSDDKARHAGAIQVSDLITSAFLRQNLMTDDQGHFRLSGIAAGTYRLAVPVTLDNVSEMEAMLATFTSGGAGSGAGGKFTIYSGNTMHRKQAKTYDLRAADTVDGIEITLPIAGLHIVRGVVNSKEGLPLSYASLELVDSTDPTISFHATVRNDGQFRFPAVPEGIYDLKASNARVFTIPIDDAVPDSMLPMMQQQLQATRAFADTTQSVTVQNSDLSDLILTLPEIRLTDIRPGNLPPVGIVAPAN